MDPFSENNQLKDHSGNKGARSALPELGYYGLLPFIFGAVIVWLSPWIVSPTLALIIQKGTLVYAAIIASYMAGMGAGQALSNDRSGKMTYLPGMIATLIAWAMALPDGYFFFTLGSVWRMTVIIFVFVWLFMRDSALTGTGVWPSWYGRLRFRLTAWVIVLLGAIIARLILWGYI